MSIRSRSLPFIKRLNHLYREPHPPSLTASPTGENRAEIFAGGKPLIDVLPADVIAPAQDALSEAQIWIAAIERAIADRSGAKR